MVLFSSRVEINEVFDNFCSTAPSIPSDLNTASIGERSTQPEIIPNISEEMISVVNQPSSLIADPNEYSMPTQPEVSCISSNIYVLS